MLGTRITANPNLCFQVGRTMCGYSPGSQNLQILPVEIPVGDVRLQAHLCVPENPRGAVLFAHGSGSSRSSARNQYVARVLQEAGFSALLLDLMTAEEEALDQKTAHLRFDIGFLSSRLKRAAAWLVQQRDVNCLKLGCFGSSTGAAAALILAAEDRNIAAVVSRGGRVDLSQAALERVKAPVLLIVGEHDKTVLALNRNAMTHLICENKLEIVPGATHLFEEPGALEQVAQLAKRWFEQHL